MATPTDLAFRPPSAALAMADILLVAAQRSLALHATLIEDLLERAPRAAADDADAAARTARRAWVPQPPVEPLWRWAAGMLAVGQCTAASLATVVDAQMRGNPERVDALSRDARTEAERAGPLALEAAGRSLATVGRLGLGVPVIGAVLEQASRQAGRLATSAAGLAVDAVSEAAGGTTRNARDGGRDAIDAAIDAAAAVAAGPASAIADGASGVGPPRPRRTPRARGTQGAGVAQGARGGGEAISRSSRPTPSRPRATSSSRRR